MRKKLEAYPLPAETGGRVVVAVCPKATDDGLSAEANCAGRLRRTYPGHMRKQLSAETIYAALHVLPRGALRMELLAALRQADFTKKLRHVSVWLRKNTDP